MARAARERLAARGRLRVSEPSEARVPDERSAPDAAAEPAAEDPYGLTPREREILRLMAEGRSNAGIATELVISPRTVETHVSRLFGKLGLADRPDDHRRVLAVLAYLRS